MAHAFAKADAYVQPEYSVYIYHHPENQHEGQNDWEMRTITPDLNRALDEAESLYQSQSYRKVEVKQRIVDPKTAQMRDHTLKIFSRDKTDVPVHTWFMAFGVVLAIAGVVYLSAAF